MEVKRGDKQMEGAVPAMMPGFHSDVRPSSRMRPSSRSRLGKFAREYMRSILRGKGIEQASDTLDEAIELHDRHMDDPKTATPKSQQEMMELMRRARQEMEPETSEEEARRAEDKGDKKDRKGGSPGKKDDKKGAGELRDVNLDGRIDDIDRRVAELERQALEASREGNRVKAEDLLKQAREMAQHSSSLSNRRNMENGTGEPPNGKPGEKRPPRGKPGDRPLPKSEVEGKPKTKAKDPEFGSGTRQQIRFIMDRTHVGTPDERVEADIRRRTSGKPGWTPGKVQQAVAYALQVHRENQRLYSDVMSGRLGSGEGKWVTIDGRRVFVGGKSIEVKAERPTASAMPSQVRIVRKPRPGSERQGVFGAPPRKPGVERPPNPNSPIASFDGATFKDRRRDLGEAREEIARYERGRGAGPKRGAKPAPGLGAQASPTARGILGAIKPAFQPAGTEEMRRAWETLSDDDLKKVSRMGQGLDAGDPRRVFAEGAKREMAHRESARGKPDLYKPYGPGPSGEGRWITVEGRRVFVGGKGYGTDGYMPDQPEVDNRGAYPFHLGQYNADGRYDLQETEGERRAHRQMSIWSRAKVRIKEGEADE